MARERQPASETDRKDGTLKPERVQRKAVAPNGSPRGDGLKPERVQKKPAAAPGPSRPRGL